ncbi:MAG TPA: DUF1800 domain-containing protein [Blastocatellia bacterium]|nr:DUF1800 domain-containing protein [Blastocatellia bacterium]
MASITYDEAAHLLRRMGFGGSPDEIDAIASRGREGAVDFLINYEQVDNRAMDDLLRSSFDFSNPGDSPRFNRAELLRWWFTRMTYTRRPFEEKMTLFWHNHFATSASKTGDLFIYNQNLTLRSFALDQFDNLLLRVAQDPAMLLWLDGVTNVRGNPNENFARELQELFTMGITDVVTGEANYTEQDVKEIARAFTGWKFFHPRNDPNPFSYQFVVNDPEHDNTTKTIYSGTQWARTGNLDGADVIGVISARRATARYLVKKLFDFFVYPVSGSAADKATIEKFADVYMSRNHSIKELVRAIFTSDEFFSQRTLFALVKSPVEIIVGPIRMLGARYNPGTSAREGASNNILAAFSIFLGQDLFNPPDVSGWKLNLGWINTSTLLNRFTYADQLVINRPRDLNAPGLWLSHEQLRSFAKKNSKKTVKKLLSILGPLDVGGEMIATLRTYLESDDQGNPIGFVVDDPTLDKKVRGLIHLIMCLSEFQLN